jgi:hypothetical protein
MMTETLHVCVLHTGKESSETIIDLSIIEFRVLFLNCNRKQLTIYLKVLALVSGLEMHHLLSSCR